MRHAAHRADKSLSIALIFFCSITLLIIGGLLLKFFLILQVSTFDGVHQFIVEIDESKQKGMLVAFNPSNKSIVFLTVNGKRTESLGRILSVPVDGSMTMNLPQNQSQLVTDMMFQGENVEGITIIDEIRLLLFANSLKNDALQSQSLTLPVDPSVTDKLLPTLFLDNSLYADNESISIINASGADGLAGDVGHELSTIGMNVISETTSLSTSNTTNLSADNTHTYTVERIGKMFDVQATQGSSGGISNITLTLGKDSVHLVQ